MFFLNISGGYRHGGPLSPVKSEGCSPLPQLYRQQSPQGNIGIGQLVKNDI